MKRRLAYCAGAVRRRHCARRDPDFSHIRFRVRERVGLARTAGRLRNPRQSQSRSGQRDPAGPRDERRSTRFRPGHRTGQDLRHRQVFRHYRRRHRRRRFVFAEGWARSGFPALHDSRHDGSATRARHARARTRDLAGGRRQLDGVFRQPRMGHSPSRDGAQPDPPGPEP